jgi:hypothetical protein
VNHSQKKGWLLRQTHKEKIKFLQQYFADCKVEKWVRTGYIRTGAFKNQMRAFRSFGVPEIAQMLEKSVETGEISVECAKEVVHSLVASIAELGKDSSVIPNAVTESRKKSVPLEKLLRENNLVLMNPFTFTDPVTKNRITVFWKSLHSPCVTIESPKK